MLGWLVGALLTAWFLMTVLRNIPALRAPLARRDQGRLLPGWALFAQARTTDMILLRRDLLRDGSLTCWREVEVAGPRRWYNFIWNPEFGPRRAFHGLGCALADDARRGGRPPGGAQGQGTATALTAMLTGPYLTVLGYLTRRSHPAVEATQFMIVAVHGQALSGRYAPGEPGSIAFVSELHRISRPGPPRDPARGGPP
jgi:hypothetical protein